jgi:hypothetical protein
MVGYELTPPWLCVCSDTDGVGGGGANVPSAASRPGRQGALWIG